MFYTHLTALLLESPRWVIRSFRDQSTITLLRHREALGDTLMLTPLARGLKQARPQWRIAIASHRVEVFHGNPNVDESRDWHLWRTQRTTRAHYSSDDLRSMDHVVKVQWRNLWSELQQAGVGDTGDVPELPSVHPELFLTDQEKIQGRETLKSCVPLSLRDRPVILTISGGKRRPVHNREWGRENYQALVSAFTTHAAMVQVGVPGDAPLLQGTNPIPSLIGRPIREVAAVLMAADAVLCQEGGLHHLARAVQAPTVVIYGGGILPSQTGYEEQLNLSTRPDCSPCLSERENCPHLKCMVQITPRKVAEALAQTVATRGKTLPAEAFAALPDRWIPPDFVDRDRLSEALMNNARQGKNNSHAR